MKKYYCKPEVCSCTFLDEVVMTTDSKGNMDPDEMEGKENPIYNFEDDDFGNIWDDSNTADDPWDEIE